jgi:hypothetical protein
MIFSKLVSRPTTRQGRWPLVSLRQLWLPRRHISRPWSPRMMSNTTSSKRKVRSFNMCVFHSVRTNTRYSFLNGFFVTHLMARLGVYNIWKHISVEEEWNFWNRLRMSIITIFGMMFVWINKMVFGKGTGRKIFKIKFTRWSSTN